MAGRGRAGHGGVALKRIGGRGAREEEADGATEGVGAEDEC